MKDIFTEIYKNGYWPSRQSRSGSGSDLEETKNLRNFLPKLFSFLNVKSVLDIPCGDFNWYCKIEFDCEYIGADIVAEIIEDNKKKHQSVDFRVLDITKDILPQTDVLFTRDCLGHFSHKNIVQAVENIKATKPKYFMATHWPEASFNEIEDGDWMPINMNHYLNEIFEIVGVVEEDIKGKCLGVWKTKF